MAAGGHAGLARVFREQLKHMQVRQIHLPVDSMESLQTSNHGESGGEMKQTTSLSSQADTDAFTVDAFLQLYRCVHSAFSISERLKLHHVFC